MNKRFIPTYRVTNIYSLPLSFYRENGIKVVLSDLDNTLDSYRSLDPSPRAKALVASLRENGITLYLVSNNTSKRVKRYAAELGVEAFYGLWKPLAHKLKRLILTHGFKMEESILIGDQILTDVVAANGAGIRSILSEPLTEVDPWMTRFNRHFEKRIKRRLTLPIIDGEGAKKK
jgi:HAD superfamily phosphatase (TIGR01668 family)